MTKPKHKYRSKNSSYYSSNSDAADLSDDQQQRAFLSAKRAARERDAQTLFSEYRHLFTPGRLFKAISFLYGERKLSIIIVFHLVSTLESS